MADIKITKEEQEKKQEDEVTKAVKALEAAVRKARRAGVTLTATYTKVNEDGSTHTERLGEV